MYLLTDLFLFYLFILFFLSIQVVEVGLLRLRFHQHSALAQITSATEDSRTKQSRGGKWPKSEKDSVYDKIVTLKLHFSDMGKVIYR